MSGRKRYKRHPLISNCKINAQPKNFQKSAMFSKIYGGILFGEYYKFVLLLCKV